MAALCVGGNCTVLMEGGGGVTYNIRLLRIGICNEILYTVMYQREQVVKGGILFIFVRVCMFLFVGC